MDPHSRLVRRMIKKIKDVSLIIESEKERPPRDYEIANRMELSLKKYNKLVAKIYNETSFSLGDFVPNKNGINDQRFEDRLVDKNQGQEALLLEEDLRCILDSTIKSSLLTDRERLVVYNYYFNDLTFKQIGEEIIGLTESRTHQIHKKTLIKLKEELSKCL